jgi:hypothetical protein
MLEEPVSNPTDRAACSQAIGTGIEIKSGTSIQLIWRTDGIEFWASSGSCWDSFAGSVGLISGTDWADVSKRSRYQGGCSYADPAGLDPAEAVPTRQHPPGRFDPARVLSPTKTADTAAETRAKSRLSAEVCGAGA